MRREDQTVAYVKDRLRASKRRGLSFDEAWAALPVVRQDKEKFEPFYNTLGNCDPSQPGVPDKPDVDLGELRNKEGAARDKVIRASLALGATHFAQEAADPGWDADMYEDMLRDHVCEYADAIRARREANG